MRNPLDERGALAHLALGHWFAGVHGGELKGEDAAMFHFYVNKLAIFCPDVAHLRDDYVAAARFVVESKLGKKRIAAIEARKRAFSALAGLVADIQSQYAG